MMTLSTLVSLHCCPCWSHLHRKSDVVVRHSGVERAEGTHHEQVSDGEDYELHRLIYRDIPKSLDHGRNSHVDRSALHRPVLT